MQFSLLLYVCYSANCLHDKLLNFRFVQSCHGPPLPSTMGESATLCQTIRSAGHQGNIEQGGEANGLGEQEQKQQHFILCPRTQSNKITMYTVFC